MFQNYPTFRKKYSSVVQNMLLVISIVLLLIISWKALYGAIDQLTRSDTFGQKAETTIQFICGLLSLLTVISYFKWKQWAHVIRHAWAVSIVVTAGLSALVWGPPMWHIALLFGGFAFLFSWGVLRILHPDNQPET